MAKGDFSGRVGSVKLRDGLPCESARDLAREFDEGFAASVERKVGLLERYSAANRELLNVISVAGLPIFNAVGQAADLHVKLLELEERILGEGRSPLEDKDWVRARELLSKELQFLSRHKLDLERFREGMDGRERRGGVDAVFEVVE